MSLGISYAEETAESDALSKFVEPGVIVLILVLNATVGVWMARAGRAAGDARGPLWLRRLTPRRPASPGVQR